MIAVNSARQTILLGVMNGEESKPRDFLIHSWKYKNLSPYSDRWEVEKATGTRGYGGKIIHYRNCTIHVLDFRSNRILRVQTAPLSSHNLFRKSIAGTRRLRIEHNQNMTTVFILATVSHVTTVSHADNGFSYWQRSLIDNSYHNNNGPLSICLSYSQRDTTSRVALDCKKSGVCGTTYREKAWISKIQACQKVEVTSVNAR